MQSSYPVFESGQVLTSTQLNDLVEYLEQQERLTRNKVLGIGIVCGLEVDFEPQEGQVRVGGGVAISSAGYLLIHEEARYPQVRPYRLPVSRVEEETGDTIAQEPPYPFFHDDNGNQIDLWELLPADFVVPPGETPASPVNAAFLADKVALLFLECTLESLRNCDINDCSDRGSELEFTLRLLLVSRDDARVMLQQEAEIAARPVDRHNHPRYALGELRVEKINPAAHQITTFEMLIERIYEIGSDLAPRMTDHFRKSFESYRYLLEDVYPPARFPGGPFGDPNYFDRVVRQVKDNLYLAQYLYGYLVDVVNSHNEFLRAAMRLEAECCPDERRFPRHVLLGEVAPRPVAVAPDPGQGQALDPLAANSGYGAPVRPAPFRHHFVPSPLFDRGAQRLQEVRSMHYRTYLLAYRYDSRDLMNREIRITPSVDGRKAPSDQAIPFYYAQLPAREEDDLARNWSFDRTVHGRLNQVHSYPFIDPANHPLRDRMDDHNFYRVEGTVGRALGEVMRELVRQKRELGLSFAVEPVYIGMSVKDDLESLVLDREGRTRAQQALMKLLLCRMNDLDVIFLVLMSALFQYLMGTIRTLAEINPSELALLGEQPAADTGGQPGAGAAPGATPGVGGIAAGGRLGLIGNAGALGRLGGGLRINAAAIRPIPLRLQERRAEAEVVLKQIRPERYEKGQLTARLTRADDPREALGRLYAEVREAPSSANLFDRTLAFVRDQQFAGEPREVAARIYDTVSLLDKAESLVETVSAPSLAEFDFQQFEQNYDGFVQAYDDYLERAAAQPVAEGSRLAQSQAVLAANYGSIAATAPQSVLGGLASELMERLGNLFQDLLLGAYAQRHPGLEHKGGVPVGGTLVLLYTHRNFLRRVVGDNQEKFESKSDTLRARFAAAPPRMRMADPREVLVANPPSRDPLDDLVVLADFCLPYLCCDTDCSDIELVEREEPPAEPAVVRGTVFAAPTPNNPGQARILTQAVVEAIRLDTGEAIAVEMSEGTYAFTVPAGTVRVRARASQRFITAERTLTLAAGASRTEDFILERTG